MSNYCAPYPTQKVSHHCLFNFLLPSPPPPPLRAYSIFALLVSDFHSIYSSLTSLCLESFYTGWVKSSCLYVWSSEVASSSLGKDSILILMKTTSTRGLVLPSFSVAHCPTPTLYSLVPSSTDQLYFIFFWIIFVPFRTCSLLVSTLSPPLPHFSAELFLTSYVQCSCSLHISPYLNTFSLLSKFPLFQLLFTQHCASVPPKSQKPSLKYL